MHYQGNIIRPPSEANAIILQVTVGCSHNRCTFCGAYRASEQKFHIKDDRIIDEDIAFAVQYCRRQKTVFLADGDALIIPQKRLLDLCQRIRAELPWVRRINCLEEVDKQRNLGVAYIEAAIYVAVALIIYS
ncbi:MAG: hypothetical protein D3922_16370, partial [Candidatus Electrothrix sp. AR1]|nr:hypothetical protein [Candidatus Electrothrix sp. AR1]